VAKEAVIDTAARTFVLFVVVVSLTGCGAFKNTLAQDLALERRLNSIP
jgi:hypothetical protein